MAMKSRKELLLQELEDISAQLVDIQYRLDASKRKPVPTIPVIYPEERHQDPFHVSKSGTVPDLEFKIWFLREIKSDSLLEMVHFTSDIYEKLVPQHLLPFYLSKIFQFSRQKLVLR